jgi:hypothetical protein
MPAKLSTIAYVHESTERLTQDFTIKEITAVSRLSDDEPTKVIYLKIKAFIPSDLGSLSIRQDVQNKNKPSSECTFATRRPCHVPQ